MMFQIVHAFEITKLYICIPISKKILRKLQSKIKIFLYTYTVKLNKAINVIIFSTLSSKPPPNRGNRY